jgi:hypothetical protein
MFGDDPVASFRAQPEIGFPPWKKLTLPDLGTIASIVEFVRYTAKLLPVVNPIVNSTGV